MSKIKVLIADDHPIYREGLRRILEGEEDMEVVATLADGEETVRTARELQPDVVVINIDIPKLDGIEAATQIKAACPNTAIITFSGYDYGGQVIPSLRAGAAGYLLTTTPLHEVISAIRLVHKGGTVLDSTATTNILHRLATGSGEEAKDHVVLHPRELEILKLVARGAHNRDIACEFHISERTVQTHLVNIFRKLGVSSRTEAVLHALREGWLTFDDLP